MTKTRNRYATVNDAWKPGRNEQGQLPALDGKVGAKAFRALYRHRFHKRCPYRTLIVRGAKRRAYLGGTRVGKKWYEVFFITPDQGWHDFIHDISHWIHHRQYPKEKSHLGSHHAMVEIDLIEQVIKRGWLKIPHEPPKQPKPAKPKPDIRAKRYARIQRSIERYTLQKKRAEAALKKLLPKARYYEKTMKT